MALYSETSRGFDKMRRRQHELGVSHGPVCQVSESVEVSRVPAVLRDAALADLFDEVCRRHKARGGGKGPQLRKKNGGVQVGLPREFTLDDANKILALHNTKVKVKALVPDDLVDPHCLASKKSLMMLYTAFLPEKTLMETVTRTVWKSQRVGAPDDFGRHFGDGRAVRNRHRHAIEQASRRWRGGRRDDAARTRRKVLISTQVTELWTEAYDTQNERSLHYICRTSSSATRRTARAPSRIPRL